MPESLTLLFLSTISVSAFQDDRAQLRDTRSVDDWRLMGQETFLQGAHLILQTWRPYRSGWDHDHCEFCSRHISVPLAVDDEDAVGRGYATPDGYQKFPRSLVEISPRADAYIEKNFPPDEAEMLREELAACPIVLGSQSSEFHERVASAILICATRDFWNLDKIIASTKNDWRDVLHASGLENEDWRLGVDALLSEYEET